MSAVKRSVRMAEALREELGRLLLLEVKDPRVHGVVVTAVKLTDDMREARVYFVVEGGASTDRLDERSESERADADSLRGSERGVRGGRRPTRLDEVREGLEKAKGFLRREVGRAIRARTTPDLHFQYDESIARGAHIERLLDEIRREK